MMFPLIFYIPDEVLLCGNRIIKPTPGLSRNNVNTPEGVGDIGIAALRAYSSSDSRKIPVIRFSTPKNKNQYILAADFSIFNNCLNQEKMAEPFNSNNHGSIRGKRY
jgi:hypothetical protein